MATFTDLITTEQSLREIIPAPVRQTTWDKSFPYIDEFAAAFIGKSPFVMIATANRQGQMDISPKGDPAGFVQVIDEKTIAIPDRPGNGRADTFRNILDNPRISAYFLVPGRSETLRVNGSATLVKDQWLLDRMAVKGRPAQLAIAVNVEESFFHCTKCVVRSNLWDAADWDDASQLASLAQILQAEVRKTQTVEEVEEHLANDLKTRLY